MGVVVLVLVVFVVFVVVLGGASDVFVVFVVAVRMSSLTCGGKASPFILSKTSLPSVK